MVSLVVVAFWSGLVWFSNFWIAQVVFMVMKPRE